MDTKRKPKWLAFTGTLLLLMTMVVTPAVAQPDPDPGDGEEATAQDCVFDFDLEGCEFEDWQPSAGELAEINAETDALVEALADAGFTVSVVTEDNGVTYVDFSEADEEDDALWEAVDAFYMDLYGEIECDEFEIAPHDSDAPFRGEDVPEVHGRGVGDGV
ncbi:MAG TPA: hypothetical protein ENH15_01765 [Actinobacteria bacterium]|nr:hypothetical protein [Actinomycetota bacterium]